MQTVSIILIFGITLLSVIWYFKRSSRALAQSLITMDSFYQSANALTNDERTPLVVLEMLSDMSNDLRNGSIMRKFVFKLLFNRSAFTKNGASPQAKKFHVIVLEMPEELQGHFFRATAAALFTISFRSFFFGPIFRRLMMVGVELANRSRDQQKDTRVETYAAGLFGHRHDEDHHNGGCASAA